MKHGLTCICVILLCSLVTSVSAKRVNDPCSEQDLTSQMVCFNPDLLALDQKQQLQTHALLRNMSIQNRALFMEQQNKWYALRNECRNSLQCIQTMYQLRQQVLNDQAQYSIFRSSF